MPRKQYFIPRPVAVRSEPALDAADASCVSGNLYQIAAEIAKERGEKLKLLKAAILRKDTAEVYRISASLCGLGDKL